MFFANPTPSRSRHISSEKIAQLRVKKIGLPVFWPASRFLRRTDEKIIRLSVIEDCKFPAKHKKNGQILSFFYFSNFKPLT